MLEEACVKTTQERMGKACKWMPEFEDCFQQFLGKKKEEKKKKKKKESTLKKVSEFCDEAPDDVILSKRISFFGNGITVFEDPPEHFPMLCQSS